MKRQMMGLFVEYYDADEPLVLRTGEMDYPYQAEQWAIDAMEENDIVRVKAFLGPRPVGTKTHDRPLFAEWRIVIENDKNQDSR
jgi:hypothetical protein